MVSVFAAAKVLVNATGAGHGGVCGQGKGCASLYAGVFTDSLCGICASCGVVRWP